MPAVRAATSTDLPPVATINELAAFERVDPRTLRAACEAGQVPGAFRRGTAWRIHTERYLAGLESRSDHE